MWVAEIKRVKCGHQFLEPERCKREVGGWKGKCLRGKLVLLKRPLSLLALFD